ncbi:serine carboxypeptidase [Aspergillus bombycis]|uniref:Pheromone-processing carboxypeptidase KEX1 n=1 Tax=Aspergillus bombycis TaxID=109264 RepID=A0A1F8A5P7_9EURO|nr:serine carboxypeptidase [Aspergillus bombycis]OGM47017.1 serine carboxypeptidase [Aspergillus bombycis]
MNIAAIYSFIYSLWAVPAFLFPQTVRVPTNRSQYEVHSLPNTSLPLSWAGRLPVPETPPGNSLFFWLFEAEDPTYDENLIIWFNGGPGCSSLIGLTTGNGPVSFDGNSTRLIQNPHSWTKLGHVLYVDQPVGTGYSTASNPYPVPDHDRVTSDFDQWLRNFFALFPHLRKKQVHMIGESWAGIYIPYFASAMVQGQDSFPINLCSISIGDGTIGNAAAMSTVTIGSFMRSQKEILQIPDEILSVFTEAEKTCGFDHILEAANQYPPKGKIRIPGNPENRNYKRHQLLDARNLVDETCNLEPTTPDMVKASILNSTCYGPCATFATAFDYLGAMSASGTGKPCHDIYDTLNDCDTVDPLGLLAPTSAVQTSKSH